MKKIILLLVFGVLFSLSCKKEKDDDNNDKSILHTFVSLTAESDTIYSGESTKITAIVDGNGVSYTWSATAGDILGSGHEVTYVAPPCVPGNNEVKCTASASNKTESKTITITVF